MYYRKERVEKILKDLNVLTTLQNINIANWQIKHGFYLRPDEADNDTNIPWIDFDSENDFWTGNDDHYWFRTVITVPESFDGKDLWINISTQKSYWDAVNPQFLLFVNGEVTQGLDVNHRECKIAENAKAGDKYVIDMQAYTGRDTDVHEGASKRLQLFGSIMEISPEVTRLFYNISVPNQIVTWLDEQNHSRIKLQLVLEKTLNLIDLREPHSKEFYASVDEANKFIEQEVYIKLAGNDEVIATCIGHTHIDIAWWWTVAQTREKVVRSFATVLKLMEEYPDYKFMSSQPQLYKFLKQRYPEVYQKIKQKVKEGRWETEGGMWLEADCNVTSGESLVRQFLHGKNFFKKEFGVDNEVLWLPDVFGYSGAMPQILKKSGIKYFMTTKIAWNQYNKLPVDTFWWKGIDGSEVFTHLITTQDVGNPKDSHYTTYNGDLNPISVMRAWDRYQQKEFNNDVLIAFGHGDGGGGPTRRMLETGVRMEKGITGAPKVRIETSKKYFDEIYDKCATNPKLPRWDGELYLEYHRGTYTSMANNKRGNRKNELLWADVEFFSTWAEKLGLEYPKQEIYDSWETILLNQFHDILPGSSIKDVYDVTKVEYEDLENRANGLIKDKTDNIAKSVAKQDNSFVLFNSLSFDRNDVAVLDMPNVEVNSLKDDSGNNVAVQKTHDNKLLVNCEVPAKGCKTLTISNEKFEQSSPFNITKNKIETPFYSIDLDDKAHFTSIFDKNANRQILKNGAVGNVLKVYEDKPIDYDNWDIEIYYTEKSWIVDNVSKIEVIENGPIRATILIEREFLSSVIKQKIHFYANTQRIDFETYVDWKQHQLLLKVEFPVDINANSATYDIQFGNLTRPTHKNTSWDVARFEVCAHKWADLSENGYGVSILNESKYGHAINEGNITLTLLKSGILPNPVTDQEEHNFTYSLLPHINDWREGRTPQQAYMLNVPVYSTFVEKAEGNFDVAQMFTINRENVIIETCKKAEDNTGVIIRMYEDSNKRCNPTITWNEKVSKVVECDLMENELTKSFENVDSFTFEIKPYEIKTFKIIK